MSVLRPEGREGGRRFALHFAHLATAVPCWSQSVSMSRDLLPKAQTSRIWYRRGMPGGDHAQACLQASRLAGLSLAMLLLQPCLLKGSLAWQAWYAYGPASASKRRYRIPGDQRLLLDKYLAVESLQMSSISPPSLSFLPQAPEIEALLSAERWP